MTLERRLRPVTEGPITTPPADFRGMSKLAYPFLTGVPNPAGSGIVIRNENRSAGSGDGHTTITTGRDLPNGSLTYCAFDWLWMPGEFEQTARNLVWQLQMVDSPAAAISTEQKTDEWSLVTRNGSTATRNILGPIEWGRWAYFVVGVHLADKGFVELWWSHDAWPDVAKAPAIRRPGIKTWQGKTGHQTLGMYAKHAKAGVYRGYFGSFGRASTAARALELAA